MLPTWGYYVNDQPTITTKNARIYGRWLGARFKNAPNIIWVNGGDRVATGVEEVYRELARGLREGDGGAHLITYHPCGWRSSSQYFHSDDWLGFNMIETWTEWSKIYPAVVSDSLLTPRKPVVLGEGAYENGPEYPQGPITPLIVRRQAWWTRHGRRLPHLRAEPDVAHGAGLGIDVRHAWRRSGHEDEGRSSRRCRGGTWCRTRDCSRPGSAASER